MKPFSGLQSVPQFLSPKRQSFSEMGWFQRFQTGMHSLRLTLGLNSQGRSAHRAPLADRRHTGAQAKAPTCLAIMSGTPFDELGTPFDGTLFEKLGAPFEDAIF